MRSCRKKLWKTIVTSYTARQWSMSAVVLNNFSYTQIKSLPEDKIIGLPKLKAFADDKLNVTQNVKISFHRIERIVGKEEKENACYQHF